MEDPRGLDRRSLALAKLEARRRRISALRKKVGVLATALAVGFTGIVVALGVGPSSLAKAPGGADPALSASNSQGAASTVITVSGTPPPQVVQTPQYYQPSTSQPLQTSQS